MKKILCFALIISLAANASAQNVAVNNDGSLPHPNAILDIKGVNKGLLIPRGNAATRTLLNTNTANGLMMYDTVSGSIWIHNGNGLSTGWNSLAGGTNYWQSTGAGAIQNTNTGGLLSANSSTLLADPGEIPLPAFNAGTRMMWYPQKSAFRVGTVTGFEWNPGLVGSWSSALGYNVRAIGAHSTSIGYEMAAWGTRSIAIGTYGDAIADESVAIGYDATVLGERSVALGTSVYVSGYESSSIGTGNISSAYHSTTLGTFNEASGEYASALGLGNVARAFSSFAIGRFNDSVIGSNTNLMLPSNPLLYVGNGNSSTDRHNAMVIYKNGDMVLKNPTTVLSDPASFFVPVSGSGTRLMWLPEKGAFRVGTIAGTQWNSNNIGLASFASGYNTTASGEYSTAMGYFTSATGVNSFSSGSSSLASGGTSVAMGVLTLASGPNSTAFGRNTVASGTYSTAMGSGNTSSGAISTSMGIGNEAAGYASVAMGINSFTSGDYSIVGGSNNTNSSYAAVVMGRYNLIHSSNSTAWLSTDPLFVLGNGASDVSRSNAFTVYKNGNTDIEGFTQLGKTSEAAPAIKMKKLTGTSSSVDGGDLSIPHGLNRAKIIGVQVLLQYSNTGGGGDVLPGYTESNGFEYSVSVTSASVNIFLVPGNCASILNKPVRVLVTYEE